MSLRGSVSLFGINSSAYTLKIRSLLRYRRVPFIWKRLWFNNEGQDEVEVVQPNLMPVVKYEDGTTQQGSTAIAYELERRFAANERSVVPRDSGLGFLCHLLEDVSDEWLHKAVFAMRWGAPEEARQWSARWAVADALTPASREEINAAARQYEQRQVARIPLMGVQNFDFWERVARHSMVTLEQHLENTHRFLFGSRPSLSDFSLYGHMYQLAVDPIPSQFMREQTPRVLAWISSCEEMSGIQGEWVYLDGADSLSPIVHSFLRICGKLYLPYLVENARAVYAGDSRVTISLPGGEEIEQVPILYQVKCLKEILERFNLLDAPSRAKIEDTLDEAGCLEVLERYADSDEPWVRAMMDARVEDLDPRVLAPDS